MKNKKISTLLLSIIALPMLSMEDPSVLRQQRKAIPFVIEFIMQACRNPDVPITVAIPSSLSKGLASQESLDSCTDNAVEKKWFL